MGGKNIKLPEVTKQPGGKVKGCKRLRGSLSPPRMLLLGVQLGSHPPLLSWQAQLIHCTLAISLFSLFFFLWLKRK